MDISDVVKRLKNRYPEDKDVKDLEKLVKVLDDKEFDTDLLMKIDEIVKNKILEHEMSKPHSGYRYHPFWWESSEYKPYKVWYNGTSADPTNGTWNDSSSSMTITTENAPLITSSYVTNGNEHMSYTCSKEAMNQFMGSFL